MSRMVTRTTAHGQRLVITHGLLDTQARRLFCEGQCHALAAQIHRLTGWQPIVAGIKRKNGQHSDGVFTQIWHALCRTPEGIYVDAWGRHTELQLRERLTMEIERRDLTDSWEVMILDELDAHMVDLLTSAGGWQEHDTELAEMFAPLVLAETARVDQILVSAA